MKPPEKTPVWLSASVGAGLLAALGVAVALGRRGKEAQVLVLQPGATVAPLEARANGPPRAQRLQPLPAEPSHRSWSTPSPTCASAPARW